jgi:chromosome segregation ATPase
MPRHIRIVCPNCQRSELRIRPELIGRRVQCKHCQHVFRAHPPDDARESVIGGGSTRAELPAHNETAVEHAPQAPAEFVQQHEVLAVERDRLRDEVSALRAEADREQARLAQERDSAQAEGERLREEVRRLQAEIAAHRAEADTCGRLREESDQLRADRDRIQGDRDRLQGEVQSLHAEFEARSAEAEQARCRLGELEEERKAFRGHAEAHAAAHDELRRSADALAAKRDRLDRELAEVQTRLATASGQGDELAARVRELQTALNRQRQEREAEGQNHAKALEDLRHDRDAERQRSADLDSDRLKAEEAGKAARLEVEQLRNDLDVARRTADELLSERDRLNQDQSARVQEHSRALESLRQELGTAREAHEALEAAWRRAEDDRDTHRLRAEQLHAEHDEMCRSADALAAERDRLDRDLTARVRELQTALDRQRQERAAEGQNHAKELEGLRRDRDAERRRSAELDAGRLKAEEAGEASRREVEQLRNDLESARRMANELQSERDRLTKDQGAQVQEHSRALESLRQELEAAQAERNAERDRAATGDATRTDLQRRLAEALRDQRAAIARAEQLEAEVRAARDQRAERLEIPPQPTAPAGEQRSVLIGDSDDREQRVEELTRQLRRTQKANERLRSFLAVFGAHPQRVGNDPA